MSQDNQFYQYGYDHYLKAPKKPVADAPSFDASRGASTYGIKSRLIRSVQSPAVATVALVAAGVLFVSVIVATYPSADDPQQPIPIVKADLRPIKVEPVEAGGMDIPHKDSTILARVGQPPTIDESSVVENLLASPSVAEPLITKEEAIQKAMAQSPASAPYSVSESGSQSTVISKVTEATESVQISAKEEVVEIKPEVVASFDPIETPTLVEPSAPSVGVKEAEAPEAHDILQKVGASKADISEGSTEFELEVARAAVASKPSRPATIHAAATSPETLEFVRSVLNKESDVSPSSIEPAAGAASAAPAAIASGSYFVQLASITDAARAGNEFSKMQKKYTVLSDAKFRVQEASLSNGTFYRIQAGPMSQDSANRICDSLKASGKPGGCLVVK
ncbi:MAG: SPOR domain-containing protein [Alphaproteobacteria bacterium]